jgi:hypothetical protein
MDPEHRKSILEWGFVKSQATGLLATMEAVKAVLVLQASLSLILALPAEEAAIMDDRNQ